MEAKSVLVCPLDWGLGHASRCVPLIRLLLEEGFRVTLAADKRPYEFFRKEFPHFSIIRFPGYRFSYPERGSMNLKMLFSAPRILYGIYKENRQLRKILRENTFDIVISDNRFGAWNPGVYSVYICHQLRVKIPGCLHFLESILYALHRFFISHYDECWIPDNETGFALSGELSHFGHLPANASFIGPLSRFAMLTAPDAPAIIDIAVVLSGPEPQRSILEDLLVNELRSTNLKTAVLRGVTEGDLSSETDHDITVYSHLGTTEMYHLLSSASLIICRPGYSGIMDLACLGKKALFIPTPGQTEQEYLAEYYSEKGIFYFKPQHSIDLNTDIPEAMKFAGIIINFDFIKLKEKILGLK